VITTRVALGADHAGVELKQMLMYRLHEVGYLTVDVGTHGDTPVDYPDYAQAVARAMIDGQAERGVLICGSGIGASIAVNKIPGIRGGLCHDTYSARQGVQHDDMNVLALGESSRSTHPSGPPSMSCFSGWESTATRHHSFQAVTRCTTSIDSYSLLGYRSSGRIGSRYLSEC
jgi:ribose 5-phosphate isomerase B